jgi:RHS repeat-associated protein
LEIGKAATEATSLPVPNASLSVAFTYDKIGRVLSAASGQSLTYSHEPAGAWSSMAYPGGLAVTTCFDAAGRVSRIKEAANCTNDSGLLARYAYDAASRRTQVVLGNGTSTSFTYDPQSRLASLSHDLAGTASDVSWSQSYNRVGQIVTSSRTNDAYAWTGHYNVTRAYTTNPLDQYTRTTTRGLGWDGRGNLALSASNRYVHDSENRLISARNVALTHDALGRLVRMGNATGPHALYDGNELVVEFDAAGTAIRRHVHGPGVQEPIVTYEGGTKSWLYADLQGSIVARADATGTATDIQGYGSWGEPDADIGGGPGAAPGTNTGGRFGFTGAIRLHEATPDLHQMGERVYSASLGRFIEPDPIGTADDINLYGYAANDPINLFDPTGMWAERNSGGIDTFQTGLDYAGFTPGLGAAPDLLNAGIYAARGKWGMAGLSAVAAVPGWGDAIKGGAMGARGAKGASGGELTRVGRWMSKREFDTMSLTGRVVEGGGGRTYVVRPPNPASFTGARPGSVYAEFNVPTSALRPASKPEWAVIPGPNVKTRRYGPPPAAMPPATCIICVIKGQ